MHSWRLVPRNTSTRAVAAVPFVLRVLPASAVADGVSLGSTRVRNWPATGWSPSGCLLVREQRLSQLQCFHTKAGDEEGKPSGELAGVTRGSVAAAIPAVLELTQTEMGRYESSSMSPVEAADKGNPRTASPPVSSSGPSSGPPSVPQMGPRGTTTGPYGRRRRNMRFSRSVATTGSSNGRGGRCAEQRDICAVTGRARGRAARRCLRATEAWLGALLPQESASSATPRDSAAAAIAVLARGSRRRRSVCPIVAEAPRSTETQNRPKSAAANDDTAEKGTPTPTGATVAEAGAARTGAAQEETFDQQQLAAASKTGGRRRRRGARASPLGPPGAPDVLLGGAINFQFPVLFNVALKRLLKSLLRRSGQQQRRPWSRTPPVAATAAAPGGRSTQRPSLPPRVLLRSWRPLSKASSLGSPRQSIRTRQQQTLQQQTLQQQQQQKQKQPLQQEVLAGRGQQTAAPPPQQKQQQRGDITEAERKATAQPQEQQRESKVEVAAASAALAADVVAPSAADVEASAAADVEAPADTFKRKAQQHVDSTTPHPEATVTAAAEQHHQQQAQERALTPAPNSTSRVTVGRGAGRAAPSRRPPVSVVRQRMSAVYGQLHVALSRHYLSMSEWLYHNGNVVVTVGSLLSLTATLMADMRLLRTFNLLAGLCYFSYNWSRRPRLTDASLWNIVFLVLNAVMLWRVHTEHRELAFGSHELDLFQRYFLPAGMSPRQFRRLVRHGVWRTLPQGYVLQQEGCNCETLCFVVRGTVELTQGGETVETYRGGETGAVVGVEPFLSYVADLRKNAAKKSSKTAAAPPKTLASHADESPDSLQQQEQKKPLELEQQQGLNKQHINEVETAELETPQSASEDLECSAYTGSSGSTTASLASGAKPPSADVGDPNQLQQKPSVLLSTGAADKAAGDAGGAAGAAAAAGAVSPSGSIVAAAAEAAANAAAAVRTAAVTALSTEALLIPSQVQTTDKPTKSFTGVSPTEEDRVLLAAASKAQQDTSVPATFATPASPDTPSVAATVKEKGGHTGGQLQQQLWTQRGIVTKGESEELESRPENDGVIAGFTARCTTEVTVFSLDLKEFAAFVLREPENLGFPVVQGLTTLLINRSRAQAARITLHSYDAFLAGVFADGVVQTDERKLLEEFRKKRAISQAQHEQALARLGWTPEEFERGSQSNSSMLSRIALGLGALMRAPDTTTELQQEIQQSINTVEGIGSPDIPRNTEPHPLFEDWELVEDARAVPAHAATASHQRPPSETYCREARSAPNAMGDVVSYAFEEEAGSLD